MDNVSGWLDCHLAVNFFSFLYFFFTLSYWITGQQGYGWMCGCLSVSYHYCESKEIVFTVFLEN